MDETSADVAPSHAWARCLSIVAVVILVVSAFAVLISVPATGSSPAPAPSAVGPRHDMYLGTVGLTIQTTNPLQYTLVDEYYIVGGVYSFLVNYGPNWELEPDLAIAWTETNTNPATWEFHLTHNAYFVDPRDCTQDPNGHLVCPDNGPYPPQNVKASDVKFTFDYVKKNANATSYFATCVESIAHVDLSVSDPYFVRIVYNGPYAPALSGSVTCVPILPQYVWSPGGVDQKVTWTNALPIGSGPYMVRPVGNTFAMVTPPPLILDRNPRWHGTEVQGRQVFPDTMFFESYTTSGAMALDLTLGKIDLALGPNSQDYLTFLNGKTGIIRQSVSDGFEAEQAINVLPDDLRAYFAATTSRPLKLGHTNPVLLNQVVRTAIHMVTDRNKMIANALGGLGTPGDTLMPLSSPNHYSIPPYSSDDKNGDGNPYDFPPFAPVALEQFPEGPDAPKMARDILVSAGWAFNCATGAPQNGADFPLCQSDTGQAFGKMINPLSFRFSTFNTEPWWEAAARGVIADAALAGIQFNLELLNSAQMYNLWYRLDYDVWLWDWVWTPITDISTFMVVQTCHGIETLDNDNGFCLRSPVNGTWTFDNLYNQTLTQSNPTTRKGLSDMMNQIIYGYASYNLPFYREELYAMNEVRFTNWGNFDTNRAVPPDVGNSPILGQVVYPISDKPPQFTLSNFQGVAGQPVQFSVAAVDPQGGPLKYRWDLDTSTELGGAGVVNNDGIPWNDDYGFNTPTPTWTYSTPGTYGIELRVSQDGGDWFTVQKATVTILSAGSGAPKINAMSFSPSDPTTYTGDTVTLAASASDPAGLALIQYSWNWGDGSGVTTTTIPTASHQYTSPSTYTVQLTVKNSAQVTSSSSTIVPVTTNVAPVVAPLQTQAVGVNLNNTFVAFASDANTRDVLTYSWNFGDGSSLATGNPVYHIYTQQNQQYTLTVSVSDGHGHSTSSSATISVVADRNTAPKINSLTVTPVGVGCTPTPCTYTTMPVVLKANVSDDQGNSLYWQWDFNNDGIFDKNYTTPLTAPGEYVVRSETHLYSTANTNQKFTLQITDQPPTGTPKTVSTTPTLKVVLNHAPTLSAITLSPSVGIAGQTFSFSATSGDSDADKLTYTWDYGDGTNTTGLTGFGGGALSAKHAYGSDGTYGATLDVNDGKGGDNRTGVIVTVSAGGLLRVTTNPAVPGKVFVDGVPADDWGLAWVKAAPGTHTVSFGGLNGLTAPSPQTVTVTAGATSVVTGNYVVNGYLRVITSPAVASTIYVDGIPRNDWGMWTALPPGTYTVHFGAVAGYDPPIDQSATVTAGATTTITGNFVVNPLATGPDPSTFGYLRVTTNPATAAQILVNGIPRDDWGLTWVKMPPGTYTVSFGDGYGYTAPPPQTVTVTALLTTVYNGVFIIHGSLRVTTDAPSAATIFVNGIPRDDWGMWQSMAPGTYTVSFGPVDGYATPAPQTATVLANALTTINGHYAALAIVASAGAAGALVYQQGSPTQSVAVSSAAAMSLGSDSAIQQQTMSSPLAADGRMGTVGKDYK